jgi:hypothetical protein
VLIGHREIIFGNWWEIGVWRMRNYIDKTKVMIIKSNNIPYDTFVYDNNNLEEVTSYKYLRIDIHHKLNWNYSIEKRIIGGWKSIMGLKTIVN